MYLSECSPHKSMFIFPVSTTVEEEWDLLVVDVSTIECVIFLYISIHSLGSNQIGAEGAVVLSEAMKKMNNLQELQ